MKLTYDAEELAAVLGLSKQTVLNERSRSPEKLPPALDLGWRAPVWLVEDVHTWLRDRSPLQRKTRSFKRNTQ